MNLEQMLKAKTGKEISDSTNEEIYTALLEIVQELAQEKESNEGKKKSVLYICRVPDRETALQ